MRCRKTIYQDLIRIEINLLEKEIREVLPNTAIGDEIMFIIRFLQPRIARRLIAAQNHVKKEICSDP